MRVRPHILPLPLLLLLPMASHALDSRLPEDLHDQFLDTHVSAGPSLRWIGEPALADLAWVPGVTAQVGVRRPTWGKLDSLAVEFTYGASKATLDDGTEQRLQIQSYRGLVGISIGSEAWHPVVTAGVGILQLALTEGRAQASGWNWDVGADASWRWHPDPGIDLIARIGGSIGPPVELFDRSYAIASVNIALGIGYAY